MQKFLFRNAPGTAINSRAILVVKLYSLPFYFPLTVGDEGPQQEAEVVEVVVVEEAEEDATSEWVLPFVAGPTPTTSISSSSSGSAAIAPVQFVLPATAAIVVDMPEQGAAAVIIVVVDVVLATESSSSSSSLEGL